MHKDYKLKEPVKKPLSERLPFYLFATVLCGLMLWIVLIRPMTLPADRMPFIFEYDKKTHKVTNPAKQKRTYFILTAGAILAAGLFTIPVIRNSNKHDYVLAKLWANREYLEVDEFSAVCDKLNVNIIKDNGADKALAYLQSLVNKHKGKHIDGHKYFRKKFIHDLELQD